MNILFENIKRIPGKVFRIVKRDLLKTPVINLNNTAHKKNALISYITKPFRGKTDYSHTNSLEVSEISRILNSLGYNADAVDYDYEGYLDFSKYDFIIGFGEPFIKSFHERKRKTKSVFYATGMHVDIQNHNSISRVKDVYNKKGVWLPSSGRIVDKAWTIQTMLPDAVISLGNKLVKSTYEIFFKGPVYPLNPPVYILQRYKEIVSSKDFSNASKNFLWFGSSGLIHKGLDVLLDLFSLRDDIHLHICGPVDDEPGFKESYYRELYKLPNIHTYGFISLDSGLFRELLNKCAFVIAPSCSEGGSAGILNLCANGGLIPIVSTESGIDVDEFGFMLTTISVKEILEVIDRLITYKPEELSKLSMKSGEIISQRNNAAKYSEDLSLILKEILK